MIRDCPPCSADPDPATKLRFGGEGLGGTSQGVASQDLPRPGDGLYHTRAGRSMAELGLGLVSKVKLVYKRLCK